MKTNKGVVGGFIAALGLSVTAAALAGNPFSNETSTVNGFPTWDSDLINIENVTQTGKGVYVAVLDTGLVPNWRDYFPAARVATHLGAGFDQPVAFRVDKSNPCGFEVEVGQLQTSTWVGSTGSTHGTHVASTIIGYFYDSNFDTIAGYPLPPIMVRGIAPEATIIPVRVLADYQVPARPKCDDPGPLAATKVVFGTSAMVAAGIRYATDLARAGHRPMVINMSLGGPELEAVEKAALDYAIANGVIVVAAAGNEGEAGMSFPGAYKPVISAGSAGWIGEWLRPGAAPHPSARYRMWWLQSNMQPLLPGSGAVDDPTTADIVYVSDFSSRALADQELDVLAPGSWVRGPFPGEPGYNHLPWWSKGIGDLRGNNSSNFFYVGGTSMATPHVASVAALLLQQYPSIVQSQVETMLKTTALAIPSTGTKTVLDNTVVVDVSWDTSCPEGPCDPVGRGLIQADAALAAMPPAP